MSIEFKQAYSPGPWSVNMKTKTIFDARGRPVLGAPPASLNRDAKANLALAIAAPEMVQALHAMFFMCERLQQKVVQKYGDREMGMEALSTQAVVLRVLVQGGIAIVNDEKQPDSGYADLEDGTEFDESDGDF